MMMRLREPGRTCDLPALGAFILYLVLSIAFFGRALFGHLSDFYFGIGVDPGLMMWSLVWWPHALANGLNPLLTKAIWAPSGFNIAWGTCIPLASILASPLTFTLGPVATYNILCVLSLPINGFCAFLLCRYITRDYIASLLGGYIFGFSAFMLGQLICGHLHMLLAFPVPLCVYLALRRIDEEITARTFTLFLSLILVVQFLLSLEVFATMTMLGAFALFLAWTFDLDRAGQEISGILGSIVCAYGIALVVVSPYLYYFFAYRLHIIGALHAAGFFRLSIELSDPYADQSARANCLVQIDLGRIRQRMDGGGRSLHRPATDANRRPIRSPSLGRAHWQATDILPRRER